MTNAYVSLDTLKSASVLDITGTGDDARLRILLENVSRQVDRHCNRHFFTLAATRKFDGAAARACSFQISSVSIPTV